MGEQDNTNLVQQAYGNFQRGDIPGVLGLLSEDVEWETPETEEMPFASMYRGVEEVGQFFSTLDEVQEVLQFEPTEFVAQNDKVVALGHYAWLVKATGKEFHSDFAHVFTVRDGKVTRFQEYTDTAAANAAFRGS